MKKSLSIITISLLLLACSGNKKEATLESILNTGDIKAINQKRQVLIDKQVNIANQLKQIDAKLTQINPDKNIPLITTFKAKTEVFNHFVDLQGNVTTKQNLVLTAEMPGILKRVNVKAGDYVLKGQTLAVVDDGGMAQKRAQLAIQTELAKTTFERQKRLWDQQIGSEIQFLQSQSTYKTQKEALNQIDAQLAKTKIKAPFTGKIDEVITEQGNVVSPGQTRILRIVNLNDMYIETNVPERYLSNVKKGAKVSVFFPVLGETTEAKVRQTASFINPANRTFKIEIEVPKTKNQIKPNLTAQLKINDYTNNEAILISQNIISENANGEQYVYIVEEKAGKQIAKKTIIETGKIQGNFVEVIKGLTNNSEIIQEGARSVKDGQTVKVII
jgi:RND family efflux transporter MFP subunit